MRTLRRLTALVVLGSLLTSASAHAQPWGYYGHHHHDGGRFVTGLALGALGGVAAGSVIGSRGWAPSFYGSPYPVYVAPTVPVPVIPPAYPYGYPGAMTVVTPTPYGYVTRIVPPPPVMAPPYGYPY